MSENLTVGLGNETSIANSMLKYNFDPGALRTYQLEDSKGNIIPGKSAFTLNASDPDPSKRQAIVQNADATLTVREWIELDNAVQEIYRLDLGFVNEIKSMGLVEPIKAGMGATVYQYQTESDAMDATMSMSGLRQGNRDRPVTDLRTIPLPFIHADFSLDAREIAASRRNGQGLPTTLTKMATRKVLEVREKLFLGTYSYPTYGGGTLYGATTFPSRNTKTLTAPTAGGWTPTTTYNEILNMAKKLYDDKVRGKYHLFLNSDWFEYLPRDYYSTAGTAVTTSLQKRLLEIPNLAGITILDYLDTSFSALMIVMRENVIQDVAFMPLTVVQWPESAGWELKFKIIMGEVPLWRTDYAGNCGIVHGTV